MVYSSEAHPTMGDRPYTLDPKTIADRRMAARDLATQTGLTIPILLDTLDNRVEKVFEGSPSRIFILDAKGVVTYIAGNYPSTNMAFPIPGVLDRLLAEELPKPAKT
jgi:hypothetical protein